MIKIYLQKSKENNYKIKTKRIMKNTKEKVAYGNYVANSYRKSNFFKTYLWWVPFPLHLGKGSCWEANRSLNFDFDEESNPMLGSLTNSSFVESPDFPHQN